MQVAAQLTISVIPHISAGSPAPAACRRVITVVGISCRLALSSASSIASADIPVSPREASFFAASIPAGVAALPRPSTFAAMFSPMADQLFSSFNPGKSGFRHRRSRRPNRCMSPVRTKISMMPFHTVIEPSRTAVSRTASCPHCNTALVVAAVCPVSIATAHAAKMIVHHITFTKLSHSVFVIF